MDSGTQCEVLLYVWKFQILHELVSIKISNDIGFKSIGLLVYYYSVYKILIFFSDLKRCSLARTSQ